ncbi:MULTISPECIES: LON peptidase substrate-binding domain-containing protein [Salinivibrio]|uniref:Lon N-terminal domain-containing protein n=1 Tax=Salinivibrio costicola TaxID=51367 RepID=A0ABX6K5H8_SALCS|nr:MULTISPECIES: LON peptidase substrate-binding domain-containing protein [Salinivibrio]ODP99851.1 hypothetical protein BGK46_09795 [Salinivibrio sp. DV]OOF23095.1 hypothetical protein BZJ17_04565 [Salinivibrio sp. IB574]PCE67516.1 hypothetical protein B6G00_03980 [Salinivibrio sp. YCSC6]QCF35580.1 hypothetical protein E8E00_04980 [Salinivibrio sp. YCSC6]QIR06437.1 hypothetical protein HBA18_08705 [Salinivibrio costicola]
MSTKPVLIKTSHLLPGGLHTYIVPEAFYLSVLSQAGNPPELLIAMQEEGCELETPSAISPIVTLCHVADFDRHDTHHMALTLQGIECVKVESITLGDNDVKLGTYSPLPQWRQQNTPQEYEYLSNKLAQYYRSNPALHHHFNLAQYDELGWVCLRWLELLPIEVKQKQLLLSQPSPNQVAEFIDKLLRYPLENDE